MCLGRPAAECVCDEWDDEARDKDDESEEHEAGCHCDAGLDALARDWQGEAERAMETVPDRLP